jgi:hypothetical protein
MMTDFPFPPVKDAVIIVVSLAGWVALAIYGLGALLKRVRR